MEKKNLLILDDEFIQFCKLNNIDDVEKYAMDVFKKGFDIVKYGQTPIIKNVITQKVTEYGTKNEETRPDFKPRPLRPTIRTETGRPVPPNTSYILE